MPLSTNTTTYAHVAAVLDAAIAAGGGQYALATPKDAIRWRAQAYQYRKLIERDLRAKLGVPGIAVSTPYDHMFLTIEGNVVKIGARQIEGVLTLPDGSKPTLVAPQLIPMEVTKVVEEDDPLLAEAMAAKKGELL